MITAILLAVTLVSASVLGGLLVGLAIGYTARLAEEWYRKGRETK